MLQLLGYLHQRLAVALLLFALVLGVWGTYRFIRFRAVTGGYRSSYLLMIGLSWLQSLAGAGTYLGGARPREPLHLVYGLFALIFLPAAFVLAGRAGPEARAREAAFLAAAAWIVLIAFGRGVVTGR